MKKVFQSKFHFAWQVGVWVLFGFCHFLPQLRLFLLEHFQMLV